MDLWPTGYEEWEDIKLENEYTGNDVGLNGEAQIKIALKAIDDYGGRAEMKILYEALENEMGGKKLSKQGKASFRFFVNKVAVKAGFIYSYDKENPGWMITPSGKDYIKNEVENEVTINTDTNQEELSISNSAIGQAFELYTLELLKALYPNFVWHHQGLYKSSERGLDFIGDKLGERNSDIRSIGVQVKFHKEKNSPTQLEWLKFLSGCFARRVDHALFITTGRLSSEQYREARESNVIVIQGRKEITRLAKMNGIEEFELFENE